MGRAVGWRPLPAALVLKLKAASESPAGLVENQLAGPTPRNSDSLGLEGGIKWGLNTYISNPR